MFRFMHVITIALMLTFAVTAAFAAGEAEPAASEGGETATQGERGALQVFVSILPQKDWVERIAGETADVSVMVPPSGQPHNYEPTPQQVTSLSEADVYFRIRVPFEVQFMERIERSLEGLRVVDVTENVERRRFDPSVRSADGEAKAPIDPHVWLGPEQVLAMAATIRDALIELRPEHAELYRENHAAFAAQIEELRDDLADDLSPLRGETMFVFHPAFGYFADSFGLEQKAVEIGGNEPSPRELERIIEEAQAEGVRVIFVQPQFAKDAAEQVAQAIDGAVIPINPLAEDWLSNMRTIAERLRDGMHAD